MNPSVPSLRASIVPTADLVSAQRDAMLALMRRSFDDVDPAAFHRDLDEKPWSILLCEPASGTLRGFSTIRFFHERIDGADVSALYSGDTIVERDFWGTWALERAWVRFAFDQAARAPDRRWYWFLVCKGFRTYRYLPVYFRRFHPAPDRAPTPFERHVLDGLASARFGAAYDPRTGVARPPADYRLKPGIGGITERELHDPRIAFFRERNPDWAQGAELACLVELSLDNLRPAAVRHLAARPAEAP